MILRDESNPNLTGEIGSAPESHQESEADEGAENDQRPPFNTQAVIQFPKQILAATVQ